MKKIAILILCLGVLSQCKKEEPQPEPAPQPTPYTPPTGSIVGRVDQTDQYGNTYTVGLNTTTVSLFGTSYKTVTDVSGNFTLSGIPAGMYDLATDKPGCGTYHMQQINFPGSGTLYRNTATVDKPTYAFTGGSVKDSLNGSQHKVAITINMANNPNYTQALILYSTQNNIDIDNPSTYMMANFMGLGTNFSTITKIDNQAASLDVGTYFVKIYPFAYYGGSVYSEIGTTNFVKYIAYGTPLPTYTLVKQ